MDIAIKSSDMSSTKSVDNSSNVVASVLGAAAERDNRTAADSAQLSKSGVSDSTLQAMFASASDERALAREEASRQAAEKAMEFMRKEYIEREFYIDEDTNKPVFKVVDSRTNQTVVQYPSENILSISAAMKAQFEDMQNNLINKRNEFIASQSQVVQGSVASFINIKK